MALRGVAMAAETLGPQEPAPRSLSARSVRLMFTALQAQLLAASAAAAGGRGTEYRAQYRASAHSPNRFRKRRAAMQIISASIIRSHRLS